ncbi:MAG: hypothetical protein PHW47_06020 [Lachnospira sp.]|nr:hypothetical protein [Lachnospira sp.]
MNTETFFTRLEKYYQGSFDFTKPFVIEGSAFSGKEYTALAEFHSHIDKYVLLKKAQVWAADSHEFCLFQSYPDFFCADDFNELTHLLTEYMEPQLVRKGNEDVAPDHMYTYLTLVILCEQPVSKDMISMVKHYHFTKFYKLYARGYSEARVVLVDLPNQKVYTNGAAREMKKLYKKVFNDLTKGKF